MNYNNKKTILNSMINLKQRKSKKIILRVHIKAIKPNSLIRLDHTIKKYSKFILR